jgi:hypothetical protein|tara:strand:+ start:1005 stop:1646 length:642 start_codon:yes stop_codon:yes gene_type:complete
MERHNAPTIMVGDSHDRFEGKLEIDQLPLAVKRLSDIMLGIDASFDIEDWLIKKANDDMVLIELDIERERIQVEQRLHRLEALAKRMAPEDMREIPKGQTNLFDCFDIPLPLQYLANRVEEIVDEDPHPAGTFINLLPDSQCDDPLLAVTAQMMLIIAQEKVGNGASWAELDELFAPLLSNGIIPEECDEALDHLLMTGQIHEVDDDCFVPEE